MPKARTAGTGHHTSHCAGDFRSGHELPEIGSALGKGISAFKRGVTGESKPEEKPVEASEKTEAEK